MSDRLSIAIAGVSGRMGRELVRAAVARGHLISGGTERAESPDLGRSIGELVGDQSVTKPVSEQVQPATETASIWIDFTTPQATLAALQSLRETSVNSVVIGTTGFSDTQQEEISEHAKQFAIVKAGNFSLGVNLLEYLVKLAAARLGTDWDIEIAETHHHHKVDAPSGTALMLGEAAAAGRGKPLSELRAAPYDGPDAKRVDGEIGFAVQRMGGVIGDHSVAFGTPQEIITLSHRALDRAVFAHGAIRAAEWAAGQPAGLYDLSDVLGL